MRIVSFSFPLAVLALACALMACSSRTAVQDPSRLPSLGAGSEWDPALDSLTARLVARIPQSDGLRLAVLDFRGPNNEELGIGARARDALAERLLATGHFSALVERAMLARALEELRLQRTRSSSGTSEFDQETVIEVARIQGANLVVIALAEPVADSCHITARLVRVDTGTVEAIATAQVPLPDRFIGSGCGQAVDPSSGGHAHGSPRSSGGTPSSTEVVFFEDFSNVPEAEAPAGWTGTENVGVRLGPRNTRHLACFQDGPVRLGVPLPALPDDYRVSITFSRPPISVDATELAFQLGELTFGFRRPDYSYRYPAFVNTATGQEWVELPADTPVTIALEKRGDVYRLLVDGRVFVTGRYPDLRIDSSVLICGLSGLTASRMYCRANHPSMTILHGIRITELR